MFDYRYHALSLAAVLFALALGVLIGVAIGDSNLVSSAKNGIVHNLNSEVSEARQPGRRSCRNSSATRKRSPTASTRSRSTNCSTAAASASCSSAAPPTRSTRSCAPRDAGRRRPRDGRRRCASRSTWRASPGGRRDALRGARRLDRSCSNASASSSGASSSAAGAGRPGAAQPRARQPAERLRRPADAPRRARRGARRARGHERRSRPKRRASSSRACSPASRPSGVPAVGVELSGTEPSQVPWYKSAEHLERRRPRRARGTGGAALRAGRRPRRLRREVDRRLAAADRRRGTSGPDRALSASASRR